MLYTIFDLETTGFNDTSDAICQFVFIIVNQNPLSVRARNYYFYKEGMPWLEQITAVHELTRSFLKRCEDEYEQDLTCMYAVLQHDNLVGHNSNGFDISFANRFLMREGFPPIAPGVCCDTMFLWHRTSGKRMRLANLPMALGTSESQIIQLAQIMFKENIGDLRFHNACYDVTTTTCCLREAVKKGLCPLKPMSVQEQRAQVSLSVWWEEYLCLKPVDPLRG